MYPTLNPTEEQTPIPIEYAYFLEDGEQDPNKPNRYQIEVNLLLL